MIPETENSTVVKILIAEDAMVVAEDLALTVQDLGYQVAGLVSTGEEAIQLAEKERPSLVLMDINLAGDIDGIEASEQIRARYDIPVIFVTAYDEKDVLCRAKQTQPYGYLTKPFSNHILKITMETALYKHATDKRLRDSEARRAKAEELAGLHSWEWDIGTGHLVWSAEYYRAFGLSPGDTEVTLDTFINSVHGDDRHVVRRALRDALDGKRPYDLEFRVIHSNGQERVIHSRGEIQRDAKGQPIRMQGMALDITERKKAAEARDRILNMTHDLVCVAGMDGYFKYVNPSWDRVLGYTREELLSRPFLDFIHPEDHDKNEEEVRKLKWGQTSVDFENRYIHRDGSTRCINWNGTPLPEEGVMYCVGRDVTDRKESEKALIESEQRFRNLYENLRDGIAEVDERGRIVACNPQFEGMLGYTREELSELTYEEITPSRWHAMESRILREQVNARGFSDLYEKEYIHKDRTVFPIEVQTYLVSDNDGKNCGYWAFVRDITERKLAEQTMMQSLGEKEALLREIHHRVKNNLAVVISLLGFQSRQAKDDYHREMFIESQDRIRSMALAHEKLYQAENLSAVDSKDYFTSLAHHLMATLSRVGSDVQLQLQIAKVDLDLETGVTVGFIVTELLSNALKHAFPDHRPGRICLALKEIDDSTLEISVADDGVGLPEDIQFENPNTLGLDLIRTFCRQLRGQLEVRRDSGTEIVLRFNPLHGEALS